MKPPVSRRSVLQTSGGVLLGAIAGRLVLSAEGKSLTVPIFLENRDSEQHSALVEVHSTTEKEAFAQEISIAPSKIVQVGDVTAEEFCLRGQVSTIGKDNVCPARGQQDYSQNGFVIVIHQSPSSNEKERGVEIVKIESTDVQ